jgi:hypothetical protein
MVADTYGIKENRWFEVLDEGVVIRSVLEFPRSMYILGHQRRVLRINTLYRYFEGVMKLTVEELCHQDFYEIGSSFFSRPSNHSETVFNRHLQRVNRFIEAYQDQVRRGELPPQE